MFSITQAICSICVPHEIYLALRRRTNMQILNITSMVRLLKKNSVGEVQNGQNCSSEKVADS